MFLTRDDCGKFVRGCGGIVQSSGVEGGAAKRGTPPTAKKDAKWIATDRKVTYKGKVRRVWHSVKDKGARAVKRLVKAGDGVRRYRFERV